MLWGKGALDFAGGTVVHINAGIAGLVGCLVIGPRIGFKTEPMPPHSLVMTMIGASLLWIGWFGFNAGSGLEANAFGALAFINTLVATAAAGATWAIIEQVLHKKPSLLGAASGVVAGLVAITPAAGFAHPGTAIILGAVASLGCFFFVTTVKSKLKYDDSLDVFGVHAIGGIIGAIGTGIVANPAFGGQGWIDYTAPVAVAGEFDMAAQVITQIRAVGVTIAVDRRRLGDPVPRRSSTRSGCVRVPKSRPKASTSTSTASAPTTTDRQAWRDRALSPLPVPPHHVPPANVA